MKGSYEVTVRNNRLQYKFTVQRNITILRGNSATGKTTLIEMIREFEENGANSGVVLNCKKACTTLLGRGWANQLAAIHDSIVFIDEGNPFIASREFADAIRNSDNYYVIATRANLPSLPYSVDEVYGIENTTSRRFGSVKRLYSKFFRIYGDILPNNVPVPDCVIVEDSNSGYEFFQNICSRYGINCVSANGKSNVYRCICQADAETILVIADGAAFGPEMEKIVGLQKAKNVILYLPESFEWLILKSDLIRDGEVHQILEKPSDFVESSEYFSWERFFTQLLIQKTGNTYLKYRKAELNPVYLQEHETEMIMETMPEINFE